MNKSRNINEGLQPNSGKSRENAGAQPTPNKTVTSTPPSGGGSGGKK